MKRHLRILGFAIAGLRRNTTKTLVVIFVFSLLVAIFASLLLYLQACRREARALLAGSPEIIVQRVRGGRHEPTPVERAEAIRAIRGVGAVTPRVWGYSFDPPTGATLTLWGADSVPRDTIEFDSDGSFEGACVVGSGFAALRFLGIGDRFPMRRSDGSLFAPRVAGIFTTESALLTNDLIVLRTADVRRIVGLDDRLCTDIAVEVHNPNEVSKIAAKIWEKWPDARTVTRTQMLQTYDALFDWRGGVWAAILFGCVAAFAILIWDKGTGLTEEEIRAVGLLRATGWKSREILELKFLEGIVVSVVSLLSGFIFAQLHLLWLDGFVFARVIKGWSVLFPSFAIAADIDSSTLVICIALTVVPYVSVSLIPSWRASVTDPDSILRR